MTLEQHFSRFSRKVALLAGTPTTFVLAVLFIALWALSGPLFGFAESWQLVVNTGTTIITFFMVFVIQNTQNRDTTAIQLKLDELVRATKGAKNALIDSEDMEIEELEALQKEFEAMAQQARTKLEARGAAEPQPPEAPAKSPARKRKTTTRPAAAARTSSSRHRTTS